MSRFRPVFILLFASFVVLFSSQSLAAETVPAPSLVTQAVDNSVRTVLLGNVHPMVRPEFDKGELPAIQPLHRMLLVLKRSDQQEATLRRLIENQQFKDSPDYHKWVTPEEFGRRFGPSDNDLAAVVGWLKASGFDTIQVNAGRTVVEFSGTAGLVKQAFGTSIHRLLINGEEHFANSSDPSIPKALAPVVAGINSLHNFPKKAQNRFLGTYSQKTKTLTPAPDFTFNGGNFDYYGVVPYDFATIYNLLPLWNATPTKINGTGQTIAIVGRTDIDPTDATDFWTVFGLDGTNAPQPTLIITNNGPAPGFTSDEAEADIDVQWSGAAAPGATINFVTSASTETTDGVDLSALYIVDNNLAPVMSESYGLCELGLGDGGANFYSGLWQQAAAQGISVFVSSGDNGAAGCDTPGYPAQYGLQVNGLASTQFNAAVGGTDFNQFNKETTYWNSTNDPVTSKSAKGYIPETTWNDSCTNAILQSVGGSSNAETNCNDPNFAGLVGSVGGSGGKSSTWFKPTWQTGTPNDNARDLPDISLFASDGFLGSFYLICQKRATGICSQNAFLGYGGTSVASPAFAGIMALVNQKWGPQGVPGLILYKLISKQPNAFHDIPSGSTIAMPCLTGTANCVTNTAGHTFGVLNGFSTSTGYDLATGLGSVDATNLVNNWNKVTFTPSTTTLQLNSGNAVNVTHGASVPMKVTVSPAAATGDVALLVAPGKPGNPGIARFSLTSGTANANTSLLPGGSYNVIAHYAGNTTYGGSYSNAVAVQVNPENSSVYMPGVVTSVDGTGNPVYSTSVVYASPYLLRADVLNSQSHFCGTSTVACPTGTVAFTDNGNPLDAGSYNLNSQGYTEDQFVQLTGGSHNIVASYGGDSSYNASSKTITITVTPAATTLTSSSDFAGSVGTQFNGTVRINTTSTGVAPTGTVTFYANGIPMVGNVYYQPYDGTPGSSSYAGVDASIATTTSPFSAAGTYNITASYGGDQNYGSANLSAQAIQVKFPTPGVSVLSSSYSLPAGNPVTLTTTVQSTSQTVAPTGTVTFYGSFGQLSGTPTYTTTTDGGGNIALVATLNYTPTFSDTYTAQYAGDSNYPGAQGSTSLVTATGSDFTLSFPLGPVTVPAGGARVGTSFAVGIQANAAPVQFSSGSCTGLPAETVCEISSPVINTGWASISITTTGPHHVADNRLPGMRSRGLWTLGFGAAVAGLCFLGGLRKRTLLMTLVLLAFLIALPACGGGGSTPPPPNPGHTDPGTPAGTYTITVTGTSGSTTHTATFQLIVQ